MGEPGCAELLDRAVVEGGGPAQRDARCDAARFVVPSRPKRCVRATTEAVEHPLHAAPQADHGERACSERLVDSLACQPGAAIEVAGGRWHRRQAAVDLDDRALLQGTACTQLHGMAVEPGERGTAERPWPRLSLDDEACVLHMADLPAQRIGGEPGYAVHGPERAQHEARCGGAGGRPLQVPAVEPEQEGREHDESRFPSGPGRRERGHSEAGGEPGRGDGPDLVGADSRPSQCQPRTQGLGPHRADAADLVELIDRAEAAVNLPVLDDALRQCRADAVERIELLGTRAVEVYDCRRRICGRRSVGDRNGCGAQGYAHLLAVGQSRCEVDTGESARRSAPPARRTASRVRLPAGSR